MYDDSLTRHEVRMYSHEVLASIFETSGRSVVPPSLPLQMAFAINQALISLTRKRVCDFLPLHRFASQSFLFCRPLRFSCFQSLGAQVQPLVTSIGGGAAMYETPEFPSSCTSSTQAIGFMSCRTRGRWVAIATRRIAAGKQRAFWIFQVVSFHGADVDARSFAPSRSAYRTQVWFRSRYQSS